MKSVELQKSDASVRECSRRSDLLESRTNEGCMQEDTETKHHHDGDI